MARGAADWREREHLLVVCCARPREVALCSLSLSAGSSVDSGRRGRSASTVSVVKLVCRVRSVGFAVRT